MASEEFPSISVEPVGPARQCVDGSREQRYVDEHGDQWVCRTDGASRRWTRLPNPAAPVRGLLAVINGGV